MPTGQSAIWCKLLLASAKIVLASINLVPLGPTCPKARYILADSRATTSKYY